MWLVTVLGAMLLTAGLTMGSTYHGWCLGRQGVEQRVIVPAPSVTVDPAQIRVEVAPTTVRVEPPQIRVETPHTSVNLVDRRYDVGPGTIVEPTRPAPVTLKTSPVNPIVITPAIPQPKPKDIDEYGELLSPPKGVKP
jgi:hypothetical protein